MSRAALRLLGFLLGAAGAGAAPTPMADVRIGKVDYVRAADVAAKLGLGLKWLGLNRLELLDAAGGIKMPAPGATDLREVEVNGLKVWLGEPVVARAGQVYISRIDYEQRLVPLLKPESGRALPPAVHVIAIDPGHGGSDIGAENTHLRINEKTFTLDVGLRLRKLLEAQGFVVVMTRTKDSRFANDPAVDLPLRGEFANAKHADLFLSIHFNAGATKSDTTSHGTEIFTFAPDHQRSTSHFTERKDDSEPNAEHAGPGHAPVLRFEHWNVVFARAMHRELHRRLGTDDRGEKIAHLAVLRPLDCPAVLIESAFLTDTEGRRVATPAFRQEIAEAMAAGIKDYAAEIEAMRPAGTVPAFHAAAPGLSPAAAPAKVLQAPKRPS